MLKEEYKGRGRKRTRRIVLERNRKKTERRIEDEDGKEQAESSVKEGVESR